MISTLILMYEYFLWGVYISCIPTESFVFDDCLHSAQQLDISIKMVSLRGLVHILSHVEGLHLIKKDTIAMETTYDLQYIRVEEYCFSVYQLREN